MNKNITVQTTLNGHELARETYKDIDEMITRDKTRRGSMMHQKTPEDFIRDFEKEINDFSDLKIGESNHKQHERVVLMIEYLDTLEGMVDEVGTEDRINKTCDAIEKELNIK